MEESNNGIRIMKSLKRIGHMVKKGMAEQFGDLNLTGPQGMLIGILLHNGEMKVSDLSEKMGLSNSTVSGIIDRLEKQGLVERIRSSEDRRVVYVNLTSECRKNSKEKFGEIEKSFEDILEKATAEEIDAIIKGFDTLEKLMDKMNK